MAPISLWEHLQLAHAAAAPVHRPSWPRPLLGAALHLRTHPATMTSLEKHATIVWAIRAIHEPNQNIFHGNHWRCLKVTRAVTKSVTKTATGGEYKTIT